MDNLSGVPFAAGRCTRPSRRVRIETSYFFSPSSFLCPLHPAFTPGED